MPYNPSTGVYQLPAIYLAVPGTTIIAAQHNDPLVDLQTANNYPRPVVAGGTGATTPAGARTNLGVVSDTVAVTYTAPSVDNVVPRWNGTAGALQDSAISVADNGDTTITSTDAGATAGPVDDLYRNSASPAANDIIGSRQWTGEDSAGNKEVYAEDRVQILDPTTTSEDAKKVTRTVVAGTLADRLHVGAGAWMEGATGGDPGVGKFNATELQVNGARQGLIEFGPITATGVTVDISTVITSAAKRIIFQIKGVKNTSGSDSWRIQIGAGSYDTSGYVSYGIELDSGNSNSFSVTNGFILRTFNMNQLVNGHVILTKTPGTDEWVMSANMSVNGNGGGWSAGHRTLSGPIQRLRVTHNDGASTWDAGAFSMQVEQ